VTYEPWEVVVVPFPFTETEDRKRRPALVLSQRSFNEGGYTVLAMITTKSEPAWPEDSVIGDLGSAGLERPCIIRWKLFTLDNQLIVRRIGQLGELDRGRAARALGSILP
jgi:mRNA interferase MazF